MTSELEKQAPITKGDLEALEEKFDLKLGSLKAWGVAALLGGQALAGVLAALLAPASAAQTAEAVVRLAVPYI